MGCKGKRSVGGPPCHYPCERGISERIGNRCWSDPRLGPRSRGGNHIVWKRIGSDHLGFGRWVGTSPYDREVLYAERSIDPVDRDYPRYCGEAVCASGGQGDRREIWRQGSRAESGQASDREGCRTTEWEVSGRGRIEERDASTSLV